MSAVSAVLSLLHHGDHLVTLNNGYGGFYEYVTTQLIPSGIDVTFVDFTNLQMIKADLRPNTKMVWLETLTNPVIQVIDTQSIATMVHEFRKELIVAADNTFLSPCLQKPLELGVDIVMHSVTKYMNGHSDVMMGAITYNRDDFERQFKFYTHMHGCGSSPFDCYLVNRSLATLELRMQKHMSSGLAVARFLEKHPMVESVNHPGLPTHQQHFLASKIMRGYPGILSFYLKGGYEESRKFLLNLKIFTVAFSVGSHISYASLPWTMSHKPYPKDVKKNVGITENLIRLSIGLEDVNDLIGDLNQALEEI